MANKIKCPKCNKITEIDKYCVYCGNKLPIDNPQVKLFMDTPEATCLNCGRPVEEGQSKCECGYEFRDIKCPECQTENAYTNKFCTNCGKQLWRSYVFEYNYFKNGLKDKKFPKDLRNISVYNRFYELQNEKPDGNNVTDLCLEILTIENNLLKILARWKITAPNYCINCLNIVSSDEYVCKNCRTILSDIKERFFLIKQKVKYFKNEKNIYIKPEFDYKSLKCSSKTSDNYLNSLAPSIGESQFEYQERLKLEFAENIQLKKNINKKIVEYNHEEKIRHKSKIENLNNSKPKLKPKPKPKPKPVKKNNYSNNQSQGGYCDYNCLHCRSDWYDDEGILVGGYTSGGYEEYYCSLNHSFNRGKYCEDYE